MIDPEEAFLLLKKWKDDRTPLRVVVHWADGYFAFDCRLFDFSRTVVGLRLTGEHDFVEFVLGSCFFEYGEPRSAQERVESAAGHTYAAVLIAGRPSGERFFFMEIAQQR